MSLNRYAARRDANEPAIVEALEKIGCSVFRLDEPADLLVGIRGVNLLIECKDGSKPPSQRELTDVQTKFHAGWRGQAVVAESPQEAVEAVQRALRINPKELHGS